MMQNCPKCQARLFIRYYPKVTEIIWARCPDCRHGWKQEVQGGIVAEHDPFAMKKAERFLRDKIKKTKSTVHRGKTVFEEMMPDVRTRYLHQEYFKEFGHILNFQAEEINEKNFVTRKGRPHAGQ